MSLTNYLLAIALTFITGIVIYYKWLLTYWKRRGLPYLEPAIPFGNTSKLFTSKSSFAEQFAEFYREFKKKNVKHGGVYMFARPYYIPVDPYLIKDILQKDFSHFVDRGVYVNEENDPLSGHLFSLEGTKWKNLRAKLTATFTSGKMKTMFGTMASCANDLDNLLEEVSTTQEPIDIKDILGRFTIDVITSCAFGLDGNSFKNPDTPFRYYAKRLVENTIWEQFKYLLLFILSPTILDSLRFKSTKPDVENFMFNVVKKTVAFRENNNIYRKDFLHLLLQLKNRGKLSDDEVIMDNNTSKELGITLDQLAAQVLVFLVAGYETSASTMTCALYELSLHQDIQDKLRQEINTILKKNNSEITYEALMEMTYMDQVINETLRKHPPLGFLNRKCTKAYDVPNTGIRLEEGTMLVIPTLGLHYDEDFYPEPKKFDPDRFSDENKKKRPPCTWMPFGEGPRICIGLRFGVLQTKIGLTTLLKNYKVTLSEKTQMPLVLDKKAFFTSFKNDIWLNISKIN